MTGRNGGVSALLDFTTGAVLPGPPQPARHITPMGVVGRRISDQHHVGRRLMFERYDRSIINNGLDPVALLFFRPQQLNDARPPRLFANRGWEGRTTPPH